MTVTPRVTPSDPAPADSLSWIASLAQLTDSAVASLAAGVTFRELSATPTHVPLTATGLESDESVRALAAYLVGCVATLVGLDATICQEFDDNDDPNEREDLQRELLALLGSNNDWTTAAAVKFRDTKRNAWLAEGIAHSMLVVRAIQENTLLPGHIIALSQLHTIPSEPGQDAVGIYVADGQPIVVIGETKASRERGSQELTGATAHFSKIDAGEYGVALRGYLAALKPSVQSPYKEKISRSLWKEWRTYAPFIVHETPFALTNDRPAMGKLAVPIDRRRLVAIQLQDFHGFFDTLAAEIRLIVSEVHDVQ